MLVTWKNKRIHHNNFSIVFYSDLNTNQVLFEDLQTGYN